MKTIRVFCEAFGPIVREWLLGLGQLMFVYGRGLVAIFALGCPERTVLVFNNFQENMEELILAKRHVV